MTEYLEEPRNPGVDDGKCALCRKEIKVEKGSIEDFRCSGCGYLICGDAGCDADTPMGVHLVVQHQPDDEDEEDW